MPEQTMLAVWDQVRTEMAVIAEENGRLVFDYEDSKGNKLARSHVYKLRQWKSRISDVHRQAKADALAVCQTLDSEKRFLNGETEKMIAVHADRIKAIEEREAAEVAAAKLQAEKEQAEVDAHIENDLIEAKRDLAKIHAEHEAKEAERQAEEEQRKAKVERAIREKKIADEAAEKARRDAEEAQRQKELREQAERDRMAEDERKRIKAAEAEKARLAEIERKRIANKKHRQKIEFDVLDALRRLCPETQAKFILHALKENAIPHVTINY